MRLPRERKGRIRLAAIVAAIAGLYALYRIFVPDVDLDTLLSDISRALGEWTYALVFALAFLETGAFVGLIAPGETVVVLGGAVAGQGETSLVATIGLAWLGAFLGDSVSFLLGAKLGRGFVLRHGERLRITPDRFARVEGYFDRHGGKTILIGRFIGIVRALAPFVAGSSGMSYSRMAPYSILGTGIWATFFTLLGYLASRNIDAVVHASERGFLFFAVLVGAVVAVVVAVRWLREEENRARVEAGMQRRPWLRPLLRLGPQARFLWGRLTPGGLGIELTAPLAALAVGSYAFGAYAIVIEGNVAATPGDREVIDIVGMIQTSWLTSLNQALTELGRFEVVAPVAGAAALVFALGRRWGEAAIFLLGVAALALLVPEAKEIVDRPRPDGGLVEAGGAAYPSGHAAYAVLYTWIAVLVTVRLRPHWGGGTALLVAGLLLTAAIGLSRVYLGVHYMSDVSGGWGLGVSVFALLTGVAVVVSHLRQNRPGGA